jgi:hypothetical protein
MVTEMSCGIAAITVPLMRRLIERGAVVLHAAAEYT